MISNNQAPAGGGINISEGNPAVPTRIVRCLIEGNTAESNGGGVNVLEAGTLWMVNCVIRNNEVLGSQTADRGGGLWVNALLQATAGADPPFCVDATTGLREVFMQNCLVTCNKAVDGAGAFFLTENTKAEIVNCTFTENEASSEIEAVLAEGGAITAWSSCVNVHITRSVKH